ncbi:Wbp11 domain protein [Rhizoctonia solani AG-3 Rhs1AP]|uniref:Wbp11 domain protein n=1 Tax=Rhizoctonia solani AG-3 Rhs1AP TaxID=1086054 RepID=X8J2B3_9AGAM|nr:Wbp11 domain protein [Rhizoctonia solani AG-3 Rhs1AP]
MSELRELPGVSYRGSNAFVVARRKLLNLKEPFRMSFDNWGPGNSLYDWYSGLENPYIHTMQLRKERESPFFHEFLVIRLSAGTYWRFDRRQKPDENTPLNSLYTDGVPAHDTIEQVTSLESPLYTRSDCVVQLEFKVNVHVGLVLRICRAIQNHIGARVYTIQRYNCYFFAQTLLFCTACGVSDWAGAGEPKQGENERGGPWKTPNGAVDFSKAHTLENGTRLATFKWNPTENFTYDWGQLSRLSNTLIHASPMLRHADHCNHCLESQSNHRQRSLSSEINRLKHELVEYWNNAYREVLDKAYLANHKKFVECGVWEVVSENVAREDSKNVVLDNLNEVRIKWEEYSEGRLEVLVATVDDLLDPAEVCDYWYPDPDEWKSTWTCKDGGPVQAARLNWEKETKAFMKSEIAQLEMALEEQTIEAGDKAQKAAMVARINSFAQCMDIKIRVAQHEGDLIVPEGTTLNDQRSIFSVKTKGSRRTMTTMRTMLSMRATAFKNKMRRFFGKSHKLEQGDIMQMRKQIEQLIELHAIRVGQYKYKAVLGCDASVVQADMREGVNDVWNYVVG